MPRTKPHINNDVLRWAVGESGLSLDEIAARCDVPTPTVENWLTGSDSPSRGQFTALTGILRRPASLFFLATPPTGSGLPPNLRRAIGRTERELDAGELKEVRRARRTQRLVSAILKDDGQAPVELPRLEAQADTELSGSRLRRWIGVSIDRQRSWETEREALNNWRSELEDRGVLVMQLQLGSNGLRGFSLEDTHAPLVAVNTHENVQARIFTLLHEVAHLVSASSTACLETTTRFDGDGSIERWCDRVAAATLLPSEDLQAAFYDISPDGEVSVEIAQELSALFKLSLRATALGLIRADLAPPELYDDIEERFPSSDFAKGFGRGSGQRAPERRLREVGQRAAALVLGAISRARLSEREARQYLRLDGAELAELAIHLEAASR